MINKATENVCILAAGGDLPHCVIRELLNQKSRFSVISLNGLFDFSDYANIDAENIFIGKVSSVLNFIKKRNIEKICIVGEIAKPKFSELKLDIKGTILISQIGRKKILGDDNLLRTVIDYFAENKISVISVLDICPDIVLGESKIINSNILHKEFLDDLNLVEQLHLEISKFDIGQSIIIQDKRIIGIEAAEGTDNLLKRCAKYIDLKSKNGAILFKLPKIGQELRIDLPTVGIKTLKNMQINNIKILVIDSANTIILDKNNVFDFAKQNKIVIYGYSR